MIWLGLAVGVIALLGLSAFFGAPYVPSRRQDLKNLLDKHYKLKDNDLFVDFGSGDGLVVREVASRGVRAVGVEIHPVFYFLSLLLSLKHRSLVRFKLSNIWKYQLPKDTTVVYAFSVSRDIKRLYERLEAEAGRLGDPLTFICYGASVPGVKPVSSYGAYSIYKIKA